MMSVIGEEEEGVVGGWGGEGEEKVVVIGGINGIVSKEVCGEKTAQDADVQLLVVEGDGGEWVGVEGVEGGRGDRGGGVGCQWKSGAVRKRRKGRKRKAEDLMEKIVR